MKKRKRKKENILFPYQALIMEKISSISAVEQVR